MRFINNLHCNNLKGDFSGALSAALVSLPLALAFGALSGAGPLAGIYAAIFVGLFAAISGGTAPQISGPTGPMTALMAGIFIQFTSLEPSQGVALAFTVVILAGCFQIIFAAFKLGDYLVMIPHPVLSGIMSGLGLTIIVLQLGPLLGHDHADSVWETLIRLPNIIAHPATEAALIGISALVLVYIQPKSIGKFLPSPLIAVVMATISYLVLFPDSMVQTIGEMPRLLPQLVWPTLTTSVTIEVIVAALALAILGSIDSLMTALLTDNINANSSRAHHQSNRELVGQGIGNIVSGLFGGLAGAGASTRTVVNVRHGAQTALSGIFHALILIVLTVMLSPFFSLIPQAALAAILIKVASDLIDWDYIKRLHKAPKPALIIMLLVLLLTLFVDFLVALGSGLSIASLIYMKRYSDLQVDKTSAITHPDEEAPLNKEEAQLMHEAGGRILLFHISGPMSFGAAKSMVKRVSAADNYEALVLDLSEVPMIDYSSSLAIEDIILDAQDAGHHIFVCGLQANVKESLEKQGILALLLAEHQYTERLEAIQHASQLLTTDH